MATAIDKIYKDGEYVIINEDGFFCNRALRDLAPDNPHPITQTYRSILLQTYDYNPVSEYFSKIKQAHPNVKELYGVTSKTNIVEPVSKNFDDVCSNWRDYRLDAPSKEPGRFRWCGVLMVDGTLAPWFSVGCSLSLDDENAYAVKRLIDDCMYNALNNKDFNGMLSIFDGDPSQIKQKMEAFKAIISQNQKMPARARE